MLVSIWACGHARVHGCVGTCRRAGGRACAHVCTCMCPYVCADVRWCGCAFVRAFQRACLRICLHACGLMGRWAATTLLGFSHDIQLCARCSNRRIISCMRNRSTSCPRTCTHARTESSSQLKCRPNPRPCVTAESRVLRKHEQTRHLHSHRAVPLFR